jgi:predicted neuraminidase
MISKLSSLLLLVAAAPLALNAAEIHDSLIPVKPNFSPGPEYADNTRIFQGIPGMERAGNGRLWATWYAGGPDEPGEGAGNYVVLVTSGDDGKTWSGPRVVIDPPGDVRAYDPALWHDPRGRLWLFWAQSSHWWDGRAGVWAMVAENSGEESPRWSAPRRLCDGIMMNKPTVLNSGEWALPVSIWAMPADKRTRPEHRHELTGESGAQVVISRDQGKTFSFLGKTRAPKNTFDEHMVVQRRDGSLWMLIRTKTGIAESISTDGGRTWTPGAPSKIPHVNARFFIRRLASGKLLLVRHNPPDLKTRSHLTAYLSDDDGATWTGGLLLDDRQGVSYPDGVQDKEGVIRIIYDFNRTQEKQILMAAFTEMDVAAGKPSGATALRMQINQATGVAPAKAEKPAAKAP